MEDYPTYTIAHLVNDIDPSELMKTIRLTKLLNLHVGQNTINGVSEQQFYYDYIYTASNVSLYRKIALIVINQYKELMDDIGSVEFPISVESVSEFDEPNKQIKAFSDLLQIHCIDKESQKIFEQAISSSRKGPLLHCSDNRCPKINCLSAIFKIY